MIYHKWFKAISTECMCIFDSTLFNFSFEPLPLIHTTSKKEMKESKYLFSPLNPNLYELMWVFIICTDFLGLRLNLPV